MRLRRQQCQGPHCRQSVGQVVEAAGLLLGIKGNVDNDDAANSDGLYRGVTDDSVYGAAIHALTQTSASDVLGRLKSLDLASVDDQTGHEVFAKTLTEAFATTGNTRGSPGLAPPWAKTNAIGSARPAALSANQDSSSLNGSAFADASGSSSGNSSSRSSRAYAMSSEPQATAIMPAVKTNARKEDASPAPVESRASEVDAATHALKLAVVAATRRLVDDDSRMPLRNRTTAVLVDGSRMSLLALELAASAWKFGRFVVVHVSGENEGASRDSIVETRGIDGRGSDSRVSGGAWAEAHAPASPSETAREGGTARFLKEQLREACLHRLEIPEDALELVFRALPQGSAGTAVDVTKTIDALLAERGVEVVYMGCYGRRGPRVSHFGTVAHWALEHTTYQIVFAKKFSPSMVSPAFFQRPKRYLVAVTADTDKAARMLNSLLPLVSPRDSVVLLHVIDESVEDVIAGEMTDVEQVHNDLASILANKRDLSYRVRVERTGRLPENTTQTVVQRIVKAVDDEAADYLAILYDESRGSYRTVATSCLREARCGLVAIH